MTGAHDATGSLLGYLAQCRYALLTSLRELKHHPSHELSIERFDDIAFEADGDPYQLIQTKHHTSPADVTDFSVDLWKTLAIWVSRVSSSPTQAGNVRFVLLTTATCAEASALAMLRDNDDERDVEAARERLVSIAQTSTNNQTKKGREAFLALVPAQQTLLLSNTYVFDQAPHIINVRNEIEAELSLGVPSGQLVSYTDQLEGWWLSRVISSLSEPESPGISFQSILAKMTEIRDQYKADALPLSPSIENVTGAPIADDDQRTFVRQMRLVDVPDGPAARAVQDYYRAFTQRSVWAREDLLLDDEATRYDSDLMDALARQTDACADSFACEDEEQEKKLGRHLFHWSSTHSFPLRNRHEQWLSAGSYQIISDRALIGWHPNYSDLLDSDEDLP